MDSSFLLSLTTFAYLGASFLYVAFGLYRADKIGKIATALTVAALALQTAGIGRRWWESYEMGFGHAPLTNMYESVVFFSWTIGLFCLLLIWKYRAMMLGAFAAPLAFLAMLYASLASGISRAIAPLLPALQSNWLIAHVVTCFIGYAAFAVAAAVGVMYLLQGKTFTKNVNIIIAGLIILSIGAIAFVVTLINPDWGNYVVYTSFALPVAAFGLGYLLRGRDLTKSVSSHLPGREILDDLIYKTMIFGFIWLSAGIITGAVWADTAWGTYWSWDPKETWSLITWFFYAIILHARYTRGWSGALIAWLAITGLIFVLFTYYGVNFLLAGLHSYGTS